MRMARAEGVQANNKRAARQCGKRRWFALRKALWCARRRIVLHHWYADSPKGCRGGKSPAFLPKYLYLLVFSPTTARRGLGASGKPPC